MACAGRTFHVDLFSFPACQDLLDPRHCFGYPEVIGKAAICAPESSGVIRVKTVNFVSLTAMIRAGKSAARKGKKKPTDFDQPL